MELTKELKGEGTPDDGIRLFNATGLENLNMIRKKNEGAKYLENFFNVFVSGL